MSEDLQSIQVLPIVRNMIICQDWKLIPERGNLVGIDGIIDTIRSVDDPPYPLLYPEICVLLTLTSGRGRGESYLVCSNEDTDQIIFRTRLRPIEFGTDPLEVIGVPYRIQSCPFPRPGVYSFQFWYNNVEVERKLINLR